MCEDTQLRTSSAPIQAHLCSWRRRRVGPALQRRSSSLGARCTLVFLLPHLHSVPLPSMQLNKARLHVRQRLATACARPVSARRWQGSHACASRAAAAGDAGHGCLATAALLTEEAARAGRRRRAGGAAAGTHSGDVCGGDLHTRAGRAGARAAARRRARRRARRAARRAQRGWRAGARARRAVCGRAGPAAAAAARAGHRRGRRARRGHRLAAPAVGPRARRGPGGLGPAEPHPDPRRLFRELGAGGRALAAAAGETAWAGAAAGWRGTLAWLQPGARSAGALGGGAGANGVRLW